MRLLNADLPEPPFFLVGCPRSGTTLLQRLLDAHGSVAVAPETFFYRRFVEQAERYLPLSDDEAFGRLLADVIATPEFADMALEAEAFREGALARWSPAERTFAGVFGYWLGVFAKARGVSRVGEKTPDHLMAVPWLVEAFPGCRIVHLVRDPRAVVNSWRGLPWSMGSVQQDAGAWRHSEFKYQRLSRRFSEQMISLRFEDLLNHPAEELARVCGFLGLTFDEQMLGFERTDAKASGVNVEREPWKQNVSGPLDPSIAEKWRAKVTPAEMADIEAVTWGLMQARGYQPESGALRLAWPWARERVRGVCRSLGAYVRHKRAGAKGRVS